MTRRGFDPNQPRVPAGSSNGGQWTADGSSGARSARAAADLPDKDTQQMYFNRATGKWSPEREKLHKEIIEKHFEGKTPVENPHSVMLGGGSGAGKSFFTDEKVVPMTKDGNYVYVNSDECKKLLPEYGDGRNAAVVHEESSYLAKEIAKRAASEKYNTLFDGTGDNSVESINKKISMLSAAGAKVDAYYITCPIEDALDRAILRQKKSGRYTPPSVLINTHKKVSQIFGEMVRTSNYNNIYLYDSKTRPPKLIFQRVNGTTHVFDTVAFNQFLEKSDWNPGKR